MITYFSAETYDAPSDAGLLGLFGGGIEDGETPLEAAYRELGEETSLNISEGLRFILDADMPTARGPIHAHLFAVDVPSDNFEIFEGKRSETLTRETFLKRTDASLGAQHLLKLMD